VLDPKFLQSQKLEQNEVLSRKIKLCNYSPASVKTDKLLSNYTIRKSKFTDVTSLNFPPNLVDIFPLDINLKLNNKHK